MPCLHPVSAAYHPDVVALCSGCAQGRRRRHIAKQVLACVVSQLENDRGPNTVRTRDSRRKPPC